MPDVLLIGDEFEVRPDLGCMRSVDGVEVHLRPKTFQTLLFLLENRNRLVTKQELSTHLWPDTAVTDDAAVQCIVELRKALGDAAREPRFIRTVPKLGYRFVGDVREPEAAPASAPAIADAAAVPDPPAIPMPPRAARRTWPIAAAIGVAALIVAAVFIAPTIRTETAPLDPSGRPSIAVMFLDNQSHTAEIDWMRQGLAEMLITGLSRSDRVNVIGRKHLLTLLAQMNHPADREITLDVAREIAKRTQASYVLTGSFAQVGDTTRIDVRIEGLDSTPVASESVSIARQDEVLSQVDLLSWRLARYFDAAVERPNAFPAAGLTTNLSAYRAYSLGLSKAIGLQNEEAVKLFERALELDPNFVMARARLGYVYGIAWAQPHLAIPHLDEAFRRAADLRESDRLQVEAWRAIARTDYVAAIAPFERLIRLYPYEIEAYSRLSRLLSGEGRYEEAIDVVKRGLAIDPFNAVLHNQLGGAFSDMGRRTEALDAHRRYVELAPDEPNAHDSLGLSFQAIGRYDEAEAAYNHALALNPGFEPAIAHLANVSFQSGRYDAAEKLYERFTTLRSEALKSRGHSNVSIILARRGQWAEARARAEIADRISLKINGPDHPRWHQLRVALEQPRQSPPQSNLSVKAYPDRGLRLSRRVEYVLTCGQAMRAGHKEQALDLCARAIRERPIYWDLDPFEDPLAMLYLELARWDDAIAEFQRVLQANPRYPRAHYHLALAYERKGDLRSARAALQEFLSIWSGADANVPEIVDARARLARLQS